MTVPVKCRGPSRMRTIGVNYKHDDMPPFPLQDSNTGEHYHFIRHADGEVLRLPEE